MSEVDGVVFRQATRADNDALADLTRQVPMRGAIDVTQERTPDFFAIERMLETPLQAYVAERDGRIIGCGTHTARSVRVNGRVERIGHIGDLRVHPEWRGRGVFTRLARYGFEDACQRSKTTWATTSLLASNQAIARATQNAWPPVKELASARMQNILVPRRTHGNASHPESWAEVAEFLDRQNDHDLGIPWTVDRVESLGIPLEDWYQVARNGDTQAMAAWWAPGSMKQVRIHRYGSSEIMRRAWNAWPSNLEIPGAGRCLPIAYGLFMRATHRAAARELRRGLMQRSAAEGMPVLGLLAPQAGPMAKVAARTIHTSLALRICGVGDVPELDVGHPGIEVALA